MAVDHHPAVIARTFSGLLPSRLLAFAGWTLGTYVLTMVAWVLAPTLILEWTPIVVTSGSMQPSIRTGDVVLVDHVDGVAGPGTILAFDDGDGLVIHRVIGVSQDGAYATKGDANDTADSSPVSADQVVGEGRLLVPYIGLAKTSAWGLWAALVVLAGISIPVWKRGLGVFSGVVVLTLVAMGASTALSVFVDTAGSGGSSVASVDLEPPSNLTASCGPVGAGDIPIDLSWDPPGSDGHTGYLVYHDGPAAGSDFAVVGTTPSGTTTFTHLIPTSILSIGTHTYLVRSSAGGWESEDSNTDGVEVAQVVAFSCTEL